MPAHKAIPDIVPDKEPPPVPCNPEDQALDKLYGLNFIVNKRKTNLKWPKRNVGAVRFLFAVLLHVP